MAYDFLIVGAGFAGSVCARQFADAGKHVLIVDKRDHIGGNAYDYLNEDGLRIHKYGPHLFHTNSDKIWDWLSRFTEWTPYEHRVRAALPNGSTVPFPINADTFNQTCIAMYPEPIEPTNAEEQCLSTMGRDLYEVFFKGYTTKMWGRDPRELDKSVTARIPIRTDHEDRYFTDKHQALPKDGYAAMFERMLDHPNIEVRSGHEWLGSMDRHVSPLIWTGPVDEYYGYRLGPLPYRSLRFEHSVWETYPPVYQMPAATVNFPSLDIKATRATEWAWLSGAPAPRSVVTYEFPCAEGEPFYPIPSPDAQALYKRYEALADQEPNVTFLGRLGTYRYMDMHQVVAQALTISARLLAVTKFDLTEPQNI